MCAPFPKPTLGHICTARSLDTDTLQTPTTHEHCIAPPIDTTGNNLHTRSTHSLHTPVHVYIYPRVSHTYISPHPSPHHNNTHRIGTSWPAFTSLTTASSLNNSTGGIDNKARSVVVCFSATAFLTSRLSWCECMRCIAPFSTEQERREHAFSQTHALQLASWFCGYARTLNQTRTVLKTPINTCIYTCVLFSFPTNMSLPCAYLPIKWVVGGGPKSNFACNYLTYLTTYLTTYPHVP